MPPLRRCDRMSVKVNGKLRVKCPHCNGYHDVMIYAETDLIEVV